MSSRQAARVAESTRLSLQRTLRAVCLAVTWLGATSMVAQTSPHAQLMVQTGHYGHVDAVAFSPDGRYVLTGSWDKTARLWDASSGQELRRFEGQSGDVITSVAFSPDGRTVLTGSWDHTARLWDVTNGQELRRFEGHSSAVNAIAFSPDGRTVLTGSGDDKNTDNTARLWDLASGKELRRFECNNGWVESVAFSPDGRYVLTGSSHITQVWDATNGKEFRRFESPGSDITSAQFSPNGRVVLVGSYDGAARLWDMETGKELQHFEGHSQAITSAVFSPDGRRVLTGSWDKTARLWNVTNGELLVRFAGDSSAVLSVAFSPDNRTVVTGSLDNSVRLWDASSGKELRRYEGHSSTVTSVKFSSDGRYILSGGYDKVAHLWDSSVGKELRRFDGHTGWVESVAFSPDGRYLLTGSDDNTARLWNPASGQELRRFEGDAGIVRSVVFSPDGHTVLTGNDAGVSLLWDVASGQQLRRFQGTSGWVNSVAFSNDGQAVLTGSDVAQLWNATSGQELHRFVAHQCAVSDIVNSVAFSPDGRTVLTGEEGDASDPDDSNNTARLWDATSGLQLRHLVGHTAQVTSAVLSPNGRYVLTGSWDKTARLWDAASGDEVRRFEGHTGWIDSVAFSPDGQYVLTGSWDSTSRLWNSATGKELASLISFADGGWAVVDPEGRFDTNELDGNAPLHWIVDDDPMRALPLEIFMRDYYTPRLLTRILNGETLPPIRSIAEITNRAQPVVKIASITPSAAHPGHADVIVHAASFTDAIRQRSGLQDLRLFRNGQMVGYLEGVLKDGDFTFSNIRLPTSAKTAKFTAYAFSIERIKSVTAERDYTYQPVATARPRAWLVQIGVNHYQASGCELQYAANDAVQMSKVLADRLAVRGLDVKAVQLASTTTKPGATKQEIRNALASIAAAATPDDVFFLSFSGHGYSSPDGQFYILPSDIQGSCSHANAALLRNAISSDQLADWLRPIDAGEMTFVLDSCYSAKSVESNDFKPGPMGSRGLGQLAYDKRIRILAASQSDETAGEYASLGSGLLSYVLTQEGLVENKADWKPVDKKITVGEWLSYAADAVPKFDEKSATNTDTKGVTLEGAPALRTRSAQIPAVFDFSKSDSFVLQ